MNPHDVIFAPVLSEKAVTEIHTGKYQFYVHPDANRTQIKEAVQRVFSVSVLKVNVQNLGGKEKRMGRYAGRTPNRKKAIVTLAAGEKIQQLEGLT